MAFTKLEAKEVTDSHGRPAIEVEVTTADGVFHAVVPSGTAEHIDVNGAITNINKELAPLLLKANIDVRDLPAVDLLLLEHGASEFKSTYGINGLIGVSIAILKAGAAAKKVPLYHHIAGLAGNIDKRLVVPVPAFDAIQGTIKSLDALVMQEFRIMPVGAKSFSEAVKLNAEIHNLLQPIKKKHGHKATGAGSEGEGFALDLQDNFEALDLLVAAIKDAGLEGKVKIAIDAGASRFYNHDAGQSVFVTSDKLVALYHDLISKYPLASIEEPFLQENYSTWSNFTSAADLQIVGDSLKIPSDVPSDFQPTVCNALSIKVNEIYTISEAIEAASTAQENQWGLVISDRVGEAKDSIAYDLAIGLRAGLIKINAPHSARLLHIEHELKGDAVYAGVNFRNTHSS